MKIMRQGKKIVVVQDQLVIKECTSFDEARSFLALAGNEDAAQPLFKHSARHRDERIIEPEFNNIYQLYTNGR